MKIIFKQNIHFKQNIRKRVIGKTFKLAILDNIYHNILLRLNQTIIFWNFNIINYFSLN